MKSRCLRGHVSGCSKQDILKSWIHFSMSFVPINASWQEKSWLAGCGKGWDCGTVHKIMTKIFAYTKWCVKRRRFSWYKFGKKRPFTFSVNWQFVWLNHPCPISWDKAFSREFACPIIYNLPTSCWIVSLSLHIENSWYIISKGQNVTLTGKNHVAPRDKLKSRMNNAKLLKFYTNHMNCGLFPM